MNHIQEPSKKTGVDESRSKKDTSVANGNNNITTTYTANHMSPSKPANTSCLYSNITSDANSKPNNRVNLTSTTTTISSTIGRIHTTMATEKECKECKLAQPDRQLQQTRVSGIILCEPHHFCPIRDKKGTQAVWSSNKAIEELRTFVPIIPKTKTRWEHQGTRMCQRKRTVSVSKHLSNIITSRLNQSKFPNMHHRC